LLVEVMFAAAPHDVRIVPLQLAQGATVADALRVSGLLSGLSAEAAVALHAGIWGRAAAPDARLRDGDRVELTRALRVDPKEARRLRYQRDGVRRELKSRGSPTR
jgi:uncharacterized protein